MKYRCMLIVFATCAFSTNVPADADTPFDVPSGFIESVKSGELAPNTAVTCEFSIEETYSGSQWSPSVAIFFEPALGPDENFPFVKLAATSYRNVQGWTHSFLMTDDGERRSTITAYTDKSKVVLPLHMILQHDMYVAFFVGDDLDNASFIDVSPRRFTTWSVRISGARGTADCGSRILGQDDDDGEA